MTEKFLSAGRAGCAAPILPSNLIDRLAIEQAMRMLATGYRSAFILEDVQGYTHEEAGRLSGHTVGTSKLQLQEREPA